jgi:hypothetical protein
VVGGVVKPKMLFQVASRSSGAAIRFAVGRGMVLRAG